MPLVKISIAIFFIIMALLATYGLIEVIKAKDQYVKSSGYATMIAATVGMIISIAIGIGVSTKEIERTEAAKIYNLTITIENNKKPTTLQKLEEEGLTLKVKQINKKETIYTTTYNTKADNTINNKLDELIKIEGIENIKTN